VVYPPCCISRLFCRRMLKKMASAVAVFLVSAASAVAGTTTTTLAISPPVPLGSGIFTGSVITVEATVTDSGTPVGAGAVSLCFAAATACTESNRLGSAQVVSSGAGKGTATLRIRLGAGSNDIKAFYSGTSTETADVSSSVTVHVSSPGGSTSATTISDSGSVGAYTFTGTVTGAGGLPLTGTINFLDSSNGNYPVGTATLNASTATKAYSYGSLAQGATLNSSTTVPLVTADLNQDGYPDLAVVTATGAVDLLFGSGSGTFPTLSAPAASGLPATGATAVVSGDFNADGIADLAIVVGGTLQIYLGAGNGTFTESATTYALGIGPYYLVKGDFNYDGIQDLAVSNDVDGTLSVFLGVGDGTFTAVTPLTVSVGSTTLVAADFNGDGFTDLAVANPGANSVTIILSSAPGGTFTMTPGTPITSAGTSSGIMVAGAFEGGSIDLATAAGTTVYELTGDGTGNFATAASVETLGSAITHLNVYNLDRISGAIDDLYVNTGNKETIFLGSTSSGFSELTPPSPLTIGSSVLGEVTVADIDGDGLRDIVAVNSVSGGVDVTKGQLIYTESASSLPVPIPGPLGGSHNVVASYVGDTTYAASTSSAVSVSTTQTGTTTALALSPVGEAMRNETVTLTATVTTATVPPATAVGNETFTDTVTFYDGATALSGPVAPVNGVATYTILAIGLGTHNFTATYDADNADPNFTASTSPVETLYGAYDSALVLTTSPASPLISSQIVTMTATVTPSGGPPATSGTINFCVTGTGSPCTGTALLGSAQVVASTGAASIKVHLEPGNYSVQAFFLGTQVVSPSSSNAASLQVTRGSLLADSLALTSTPVTAPPPTGTPYTYTLTGTLSAATSLVPTGSISFVDASNSNLLLYTGPFISPTNTVTLTDATQLVPVGNEPDSITTADFNEDGYPDLAVTNANDATVSILLNDGTGKFNLFATVGVGGTPYAITFGDFNRDGHQDIAVANALGNSVTVLLGDGTGNFTAAGAPVSTGYTPTSIVTADFNNDGYLDLAVANYFDSSLSILYGDGNGGFTAGTPLAVEGSASPLSIATGDVNGDGVPDLVVSDSSGKISVYAGNLSSGFPATATTTLSTGADPISIELQDLNSDGNLDLIYTDYTGSAVDILFGDGAGHFTGTGAPGRIGVGSRPTSLIVGDFNGDGLEDVAVTTSTPNDLVEIDNLGGGAFASPISYPIGGVAGDAVSADFGLNDVAGFGIAMTAQNQVDIALTQYSLTDPVTSNTITVYGGGMHTITASYAGDTSFSPATSPGTPLVSITGNLIPTTLTMAVTSAVTAGSTATLSATVAPNSFDNYTATGSITFSVNGNPVCTNVTIDGTGTATCQTGVLTASPPATATTATYSGDTNFAGSTGNLSLTVPQTTPTVTWATPAAIGYGTALSATQLDATASIPGTFAYFPNFGAVLGFGPQTLHVTFTPTDTTDYTTATQTVTLVVNQGTPAITWATPSAITYGTALSATQLDATASVAGSFSYSPAAGTVLTGGTQTLTVIFTPTDTTDYTTAPGQVSLVVNKATPAITWATPAPAFYGNPLNGSVLDATANTPGTFVYNPPAGPPLPVGNHLLTVSFTPTDTVDYTTATDSVNYQIFQAGTSISWSTPAPISYGTALGGTQLDAIASAPGTLSYSPAAGTVLAAGSHTLQVTLTPTDNVDFSSRTVSVTLVVNQATPVITWAAPASITYGTALSATQLDATANTAGTFTYSPALGQVLPAGNDTLTLTFTPTDTANYLTTTANVPLVVTKGTPSITWSTPAAINYGTALSSTQLDATANTGGSFSYSPAAGTVLAAGSHTLTATFTPGDTSDYGTQTANVSLLVNPSLATITWSTPAAISYGTPLSGTQLNATANIAGSFSYSPAAGTVLTVGNHLITATFTPTDTTDYSVTTATVTLVVTQANAVLTWATPAAISYGTALSGAQLDASANVAGSFSYSPASGTVLAVGSHTLTATFTPTDTTDYAVTTATVTLVVNPAAPAIAWPTPAAIIYGTALSGTQLDASAGIAGSFSYSPALGTVLGAGAHTLTVTFTPTDTTDNSTATATVQLTVSKAVLTVTAASFTIGLSQTIPNLTASITGFVNGDVSFSSISGSPTLALTPTSPTLPGTYPIAAAIGTLASANYSFQFVNGVLTINKGTVGIALAAPAAANLNASVTLTVTLSPSTTVTPTGSVSILDGTTPIGSGQIGTSNVLSIPVTFTTSGNHSITAVYVGDLDYTGNTSTASIVNVLSASYSITIAPASLVIHAGQSALTTITLNSYGGYKGTATLSCVGLPVWAGCTFAPATLTADGSGTAVSSKMTIQTLGNATGVVIAMNSTPGGRNAAMLAEIWLPLGFASLLLAGIGGRKRAAARKLLIMLLFAGVLVSITGCGSADCCSVPEATTGTYQVTVSATTSGSAAQTAAFSLQVLP
jgi:hypothetical protein